MLGRLRNRRFFSLDELNAAVAECVTAINAKVMKRIGKSRNELFASLDRPVLKALPTDRYQYAEWKRCTVAPDYHVEVDDHYYSVPYTLLRETVDARFTDSDRRAVPQGRAHRQPPALARRAQAYDDARAHAARPSPLRRVDAGTHVRGGGEDRPGNGRAVRGDHEGQAASRAGISRLSRHHRAREGLRRRARRGGGQARQRHRRHHLRLDQVDPGEWARPCLRQAERAGLAPRSSTPTSVAVATTTEPQRDRQPRE